MMRRILFLGVLLVVLAGCRKDGWLPGPGTEVIPIPADIYPAVSPDGRYVIFTHMATDSVDTSSLYVLDLESGTKQSLSFLGWGVDFSPDGRWLVFNVGVQIFKVRLKKDMSGIDSSTLRQLTYEGRNYFPAWSPDGNLIAFDSNREGWYSIWFMDTTGQDQRIFWEHGRYPDWSPDGSRVLLIRLIDSVSHGIIVDTLLRDTFLVDVGANPVWSPDGEWVGYTVYGPGLRMAIYVTRVDGSEQRELIEFNLRFDDSWTPAEPGGQVAWLDSNTLIFSAPNPEATSVVLWKINIDGTGLKQVTY